MFEKKRHNKWEHNKNISIDIYDDRSHWGYVVSIYKNFKNYRKVVFSTFRFYDSRRLHIYKKQIKAFFNDFYIVELLDEMKSNEISIFRKS